MLYLGMATFAALLSMAALSRSSSSFLDPSTTAVSRKTENQLAQALYRLRLCKILRESWSSHLQSSPLRYTPLDVFPSTSSDFGSQLHHLTHRTRYNSVLWQYCLEFFYICLCENK